MGFIDNISNKYESLKSTAKSTASDISNKILRFTKGIEIKNYIPFGNKIFSVTIEDKRNNNNNTKAASLAAAPLLVTALISQAGDNAGNIVKLGDFLYDFVKNDSKLIDSFITVEKKGITYLAQKAGANYKLFVYSDKLKNWIPDLVIDVSKFRDYKILARGKEIVQGMAESIVKLGETKKLYNLRDAIQKIKDITSGVGTKAVTGAMKPVAATAGSRLLSVGFLVDIFLMGSDTSLLNEVKQIIDPDGALKDRMEDLKENHPDQYLRHLS